MSQLPRHRSTFPTTPRAYVQISPVSLHPAPALHIPHSKSRAGASSPQCLPLMALPAPSPVPMGGRFVIAVCRSPTPVSVAVPTRSRLAQKALAIGGSSVRPRAEESVHWKPLRHGTFAVLAFPDTRFCLAPPLPLPRCSFPSIWRATI